MLLDQLVYYSSRFYCYAFWQFPSQPEIVGTSYLQQYSVHWIEHRSFIVWGTKVTRASVTVGYYHVKLSVCSLSTCRMANMKLCSILTDAWHFCRTVQRKFTSFGIACSCTALTTRRIFMSVSWRRWDCCWCRPSWTDSSCDYLLYSIIDNSPFVNLIHSFILQSVLRQVRSLLESEFSTQCDLVFPLLISSIFSFH